MIAPESADPHTTRRPDPATRRPHRPATEPAEPQPPATSPPWHTTPATQLPNLRLDVHTHAPHAIVRLDGELDVASSNPLVQHLSQLLSQGHTRLVIDLTHLTFCDATGLGALVRISRQATAHGGWLRIASTQPRMTRIMNITHLTRTLPGYQTTQDALTG